jgi:hypothetical protein
MAAKRKPWSDAHTREARRRTYELAAELSADWRKAKGLIRDVWESATCGGEDLWRESIGAFFSTARVDAEVRRVRALAEGRFVRETETMWRLGHGCLTRNPPGMHPARPVRVQRIRRARAT